MQRKWLTTIGSTVTALVILTSSGLAAEMPPLPPGVEETTVMAGPIHGEIMTLEGTLEKNQYGNYLLDGRVLLGDEALLESLLGQSIWVLGTHEGGETSLKVNLHRVERAIALNRTLPQFITVDGAPVTFDQAPYMHKGTLMIPLRAVVEAAGGTIEWDALAQRAYVLLKDRTAYFTVGQSNAELHIHNAMMVNNQIAMDQQVVLQGGRMYISADALSNVLGMVEAVSTDLSELNLRSVAAQFETSEVDPMPVDVEPVDVVPVDLSYELSWSGTTLQVTGNASIPDVSFAVLLDGQVIAQSDAQVKEGVYITNILVEGGAFQAGKLELQIIDPATGEILVFTPAGNHLR